MKRRLFCLLLVLSICISCGVSAHADGGEDEMLQVLSALGIMNGDENGNLNLSGTVTRAQFAKMAVAASRLKDASAGTAKQPFADVSAGHWAAPFIAAAAESGWLNGYPDGSFQPDRGVTLAEAVTALEKLLGYSDGDFVPGWPGPQLALARNLSLTQGVTADAGETLSRRTCARLVYNTLHAQTKSGKVYAQSLGFPVNEKGVIDCAALVNSVTKGPVVVESLSWAEGLGFTPLHVLRNGAEVSAASVRIYDVVYYSEKMSTVWAYSKSVSGELESVLPNASSPDSITVSGSSYALGTTAARYAVSALGTFKPGDRVTLLLGRDDVVAAVLVADEADGAAVGVVTAVGVETHVSGSGDRSVKNYITLTATDGQSRKYVLSADPGVQAGEIVAVYEQGGMPAVEKLAPGGVSGRVNSAGSQIGAVKLRQNVEILDVYGTTARKITPDRLAGVTISEGDVLACVMTRDGEVAKLVLNDVTGDVHSYALLMDKSSIGGQTFYYKYVCGGVSVIYPAQVDLGGDEGGVRIRGSVSAPMAVDSLSNSPVSAMDAAGLTTPAGRFDLTASVQIYILSDGGAELVKADRLDMASYSLTAWYDALPAEGGALRIITAQAK